jgi:hypothetical protein
MRRLKNDGLEVRSVYEFRPEDYEQEFWQQYRGEKTKPKIIIYENKTDNKFLLAININGKIFPRWKAIAALIKFCCIVERSNTGSIKSLQQAFYEHGLKLEEFAPAIFTHAEAEICGKLR